MQIEEWKCVLVQRLYHVKISLDKDEYFFIVTTIEHDDKQHVVQIKRGKTSYDCQKRLTTSQKKQINRMIELMF